jgi:hypothetical protein
MAVLTSEADKPTETHEQPAAYDESVDDADARPARTGGRPSAPALAAIALAVVLACLITYSLLRIAGEEHYQSCVAGINGRYGTASDPLTRLARVNGVKACSNSPF